MLTEPKSREYYQALLEKKSEYEGVFYVGVKTTGVFCRPTCPARKPKFENCTFFLNAEQALLASFRPCKRCKPLSHPNHETELVRTLVDAVEKEPEKRWTNQDLQEFSIDPSTARRQFKKRFGMTFVEYARARRMGLAMKHIRSGKPVIDAQLSSGYESSSGFRDAFSRIMGDVPTQTEDHRVLKASWIDTPLGPMVAIANEEALLLLEFVDRRGLEREVERLRENREAAIIPGESEPIRMIKRELELYFVGKLTTFQTPVQFLGTPFQKSVWHQLQAIPSGETRSYTDMARKIGNPQAVRAVGRANGMNQLAIIVPCHRIIQSDGSLGGYGGGIARKEWLLSHEKRI
ncbi:bifunctional transcriptional activator/DNA repair enzyme AdaA [Halobacillus salinus]|uniref:bifunctional transcriptional activator/DNA repair enzyme AdaA n=1 Tax=Halobacillus salinus TaxID=192814 RepID=UPI0009A5975A|nr:bifunctional transcriptional activator/DNA repair protein Ada [Halobacillus salinus]